MRNFEISVGKKNWRKEWKRVLAWVLCVSLVASTVDVTALATGVAMLAEEVASVVPEGLPAGAYTSPDVTVEPEAEFGTRRLSQQSYYCTVGESVTFAVYAWTNVDGATLTYTWTCEDETLTETSDTLTIASVSAEDFTKDYKCTISDGTNSKTYTFWVNEMQGLYACWTGDEANKTSYINGETVNLEIEVQDVMNRKDEISYEWYKLVDNQYCLIEGETEKEYSFQIEEYTTIRCVVSCGGEEVFVDKNIFVTSAMGVTNNSYAPDVDKYILYGEKETLVPQVEEILGVSSTDELIYQWYDFMGTLVGNEKTYDVELEESNGDGFRVDYRVVVTTSQGKSVTQWFRLTFYSEPVTVSCFQKGVARSGRPYSLVLNVQKSDTVTEELTYQWYKGYEGDGEKLDGETSSELSFDSLTEDDFANYYVEVSYGTGTSVLASTSIAKTQYAVWQSAYAVNDGDEVSFEPQLFDKDDTGVTYAWYSGLDADTVLSTERIYKVIVNDTNSATEYYCVMKKGTQQFTTQYSHWLYELSGDNNLISTNQSHLSVDWNLQNTVRLYAGEKENATYQWYQYDNIDTYDWKAIEGETHSTISVTKEDVFDLTANYSQWKVEMTVDGNVDMYEFVILPETTFCSEDSSVGVASTENVIEGETVILEAPKMESVYDLSYQWFYQTNNNGRQVNVDIEGATDASYVFGATQTYIYGVRISDGNKSVNYQVASLNVLPKGAFWIYSSAMSGISTYPGAKDISMKGILNNACQNLNNVKYQWQKEEVVNGTKTYVDIAGAINAEYVIPVMTEDAFGNYRCVATCGSLQTTCDTAVTWGVKVIGMNRASGFEDNSLDVFGRLGDPYRIELEEYAPDSGVTYQWYNYNEDTEEYDMISGATSHVLSGVFESLDDLVDKKCILKLGEQEREVYIYMINAERSHRYTAYIPKSVSDEKAVIVKLNESYTMEVPCYEEKNANVTYTWHKFIGDTEIGQNVSKVIEGANGSKLTLNVNEIGDYGTYWCMVENEDSDYIFEYHILGDAAVTDVDIEADETVVWFSALGNRIWLEANVLPMNARNRRVTWTSSDESIAKIYNERGIIEAVSKGTVTLTATSVDNPEVKDTVKFTVELETTENGHEHIWEEYDGQAPTCTEDGWSDLRCTVKGCFACEYKHLQPISCKEDAGTVTKEATFTETGIKLYRCIHCGEVLRNEILPKLTTHSHVWGEWTVTQAATCLSAGMQVRTCIADGCTQTESQSIVPLEHISDAGNITKVATTTETGVKEYHCILCNTLLKSEELPKVLPSTGTTVKDTENNADYVVIESEDGKVEVEYKAPDNKKDKTIKIPDTITTADGTVCEVTSVADDAFKNNTSVKNVVIGDNITEIGDNAFSGCKNLTNVTIGDKVEEIGDNAFKNCSKVKQVKMPDSVTTIGDNAFSGCKNATTIKVGKNVEEIGDNAFKNCAKVKKLEIPSKVNKLGDNAFSGCKKLKTITVKSTKLTNKNVDKKAFKGVGKGTTIKVPKKKVDDYKKLFKKKGLNKNVKVKK